jgi:hypothetical protein
VDFILSEQWASECYQESYPNPPSGTQIAPYDPWRVALVINNSGDSDIYISRRVDASESQSMKLLAGATVEFTLLQHGALAKSAIFVVNPNGGSIYVLSSRHHCGCLVGGK